MMEGWVKTGWRGCCLGWVGFIFRAEIVDGKTLGVAVVCCGTFGLLSLTSASSSSARSRSAVMVDD
jgi:threonine dehydrogenase-like Zn-dependent dehydrogenase